MNFKSINKYLFETSKVVQSLKDHSKEIIQISLDWSPYRSVASWYLWQVD